MRAAENNVAEIGRRTPLYLERFHPSGPLDWPPARSAGGHSPYECTDWAYALETLALIDRLNGVRFDIHDAPDSGCGCGVCHYIAAYPTDPVPEPAACPRTRSQDLPFPIDRGRGHRTVDLVPRATPPRHPPTRSRPGTDLVGAAPSQLHSR